MPPAVWQPAQCASSSGRTSRWNVTPDAPPCTSSLPGSEPHAVSPSTPKITKNCSE